MDSISYFVIKSPNLHNIIFIVSIIYTNIIGLELSCLLRKLTASQLVAIATLSDTGSHARPDAQSYTNTLCM